MRKQTQLEKNWQDRITEAIGIDCEVSLAYQDSLNMARNHLNALYGERANWNNCLKKYYRRSPQPPISIAATSENIPIITSDTIQQLFDDEIQSQKKINELHDLIKTIDNASDPLYFESLKRAAMLFGIWPDQPEPGLFQWLIDRDGMTSLEKDTILNKISNAPAPLAIIIRFLYDMFIPGMQKTFPHTGTVWTQDSGLYHYRGENAFFASSKPSIFRPYTPMSFLKDLFILSEACLFLDQFDVIKQWEPSNVNYFALAQHYGIKTPVLDITSDLKTALFFACCKYLGGRWLPLDKQDFSEKTSRSGTKDARYGLLYRSPAEITAIKWALTDESAGLQLITPIGYQPFNRCSAQHGYMFMTSDPTYDMQKDSLFEKYLIELNEDLCHWIYEEMHQGESIYPTNDIPNIETYMKAIRNTHRISNSTFEYTCKLLRKRLDDLTEADFENFKDTLRLNGLSVVEGSVEFITHNRLQKINKRYTINDALKNIHDTPLVRIQFNI